MTCRSRPPDLRDPRMGFSRGLMSHPETVSQLDSNPSTPDSPSLVEILRVKLLAFLNEALKPLRGCRQVHGRVNVADPLRLFHMELDLLNLAARDFERRFQVGGLLLLMSVHADVQDGSGSHRALQRSRRLKLASEGFRLPGSDHQLAPSKVDGGNAGRMLGWNPRQLLGNVRDTSLQEVLFFGDSVLGRRLRLRDWWGGSRDGGSRLRRCSHRHFRTRFRRRGRRGSMVRSGRFQSTFQGPPQLDQLLEGRPARIRSAKRRLPLMDQMANLLH